SFSFYYYDVSPYLHSFPTRRSSDLVSVDIESIGFKPTRNSFALRVTGDSMIGRHILAGDVVVLEHGPEPRNGQVVAALIDGESTDRKSTRLNSSHVKISYAVFCLKK